jgi:hypothetical protein
VENEVLANEPNKQVSDLPLLVESTDGTEDDEFLSEMQDCHHSDCISLTATDTNSKVPSTKGVQSEVRFNCDVVSKKGESYDEKESDSYLDLNGPGCNPLHASPYNLKSKKSEILRCIGEDVTSIDLWRLREFALTEGGYVDVSIRKIVWPIVTQCHVDIFSKAGCHISPSTLTEASCYPNSPLTKTSIESSDSDACTWMYDVRHQLKEKAGQHCAFNPSDSTSSAGSFVTSTSLVSQCTRPNYNSSVNKVHFRTIYNVLLILFAQRPTSSDFMTSKAQVVHVDGKESKNGEHPVKYHYYSGLVSLTELFVKNLESPSLATLIL